MNKWMGETKARLSDNNKYRKTNRNFISLKKKETVGFSTLAVIVMD